MAISNKDCVGGLPSLGNMFHWNQLGFLMLLALANKDLVMDQPDKRRRLTHCKQIMKNEPIALNKETSHDGIDRKNLAIFLNSLPINRMEKFQKWTMKHFGFKTVVQKTEGHLSVNVVEEGQNSQINLSDSGFGYSQILPIITQLWELSSRNKGHSRSEQVVPLVVAIEQPELHLHPAMADRRSPHSFHQSLSPEYVGDSQTDSGSYPLGVPQHLRKDKP